MCFLAFLADTAKMTSTTLTKRGYNYYRATPDSSLVKQGESISGSKKRKDRLTILLTANMTGSDLMKPLVIGTSKKPRCFKNVEFLPVDYQANKSAWMSSKIFTAWLSRIDVRMRLNDRKIALAMDHCPAHPSDARLIKIELIPPPNTTSVIQPLDGGIIRCLKAHYRRLLMDKILQRLDAGLEDTAQESSKSISVLDALHLISKAWKRVSRETEQNFFHKYGFAPAGSSDDCAADEVDNLRLDPSFITRRRR